MAQLRQSSKSTRSSDMMSLRQCLRWPIFVFAVLTLYWSMSVLFVTYYLKWLDFTNKRNDVLGWAKGMKAIFRYKVLKVGDQELYREKCMYLCNHRSWADFLVDQYATEGRSLFLSRWAVMLAFPLFVSANYFTRTVVMFKRGSIADKEKFNSRIDAEFAASTQTGLAVYPEGHRSTRGQSLPLKRGMLHYAYSRKLPVQVIIGANKESILSEKQRTARLCQTVAVGFSDVVRAEQYSDFEQYMAKVQDTWDRQWDAVFSADWTGLPELPEVQPQFDYPLDIKLRMFLMAPFQIAAAAVVAFSTFRLWRAAFALLGPLQLPAIGLLAAYVAASFYVYAQAVDARTLHEEMLKQRKHAPTTVVAAGNGAGAATAAAKKLS